jgi:hypothetical protein
MALILCVNMPQSFSHIVQILYCLLMLSHFPLFPFGADGSREGSFNHSLPAVNESLSRPLPSIKVLSFNSLLLSDNIKKFPTPS